MSLKRILLMLYVATSISELAALIFNYELLHHITKPLLMVLLLLYFVVDQRHRQHRLFLIIVLALVFSWLGDVMLMYQQNDAMYFMLGLGAFLIAHVFYIIGYRKARIENFSHDLSKPRSARYTFFLLIIFLTLMTVLLPHLGEMLIPVIIYAFAITVMAITALHRFGKTTKTSFWMVMGGALIFMFSDSSIAINKFLEPINHASIIIMTTYLTAQYLIVEGVSKHILVDTK